jgi:hypothetical protein
MIMCPKMFKLLTGVRFNRYDTTNDTNWQQAFGHNPLRWSLIQGSISSSNFATALAFSDSPPTEANISMPTTTGHATLTREEIGDMITLPVWIRKSTAATDMSLTSISVQPEALYEYLSK